MKNVDIISRVVARKGETLSSSSRGATKIDFSDYLLKSIWEKVFEIRTDSQGTDYIFSKLPVVTQYGITMYSGDGVDIPSLASGLPFDGRTIWYNPNTNQIEVIGGTGGGSGEGVSNFWDLSGIPSWITISKPKYTYSEIAGTPDLSAFATQDWIKSQGYASAEELKKYIPISGYTEVSGEKNFTGGLKVNGSPIYYDTEKKYWKLEGDLLVTGGVTMYGVDSTDIPSLINSLPVASTKEKGVAYFDPDFFSVSSDGKVSFIGETGGGLDIVSLQNYLTQNSYLNVTEGDNRYLKLSGGELDGSLTINNGADLMFKAGSTSQNDSGDLVFANYNGEEIGRIWNNNGVFCLRYSSSDNSKVIVHSENYAQYALPLSGGTVTGNLSLSKYLKINAWIGHGNGSANFWYDGTQGLVKIEAQGIEVNGYRMLNANNYSSYALPLNGGTLTGTLTVNSNLGVGGYIINKAHYLFARDNANADWIVTTKNWGAEYTLWHSGNDGSGSGLDADTLDGIDSENYFYERGQIVNYADANDYWRNGAFLNATGNGTGNSNFPQLYSIFVNFTSGQFEYISQLSLGIHKAYYRVKIDSWSGWREFAFTDSNVASATKLQTARIIWGQSFDGTGNVSGTIKTMSGHGLHLAVSDETYWQSKGIISTSWVSGIGDYTDILVPSSVANSAKIRLLKDGNVGIGVDSPSQKLHVSGNIKGNIIYGTNIYANTGGDGIYMSGSGIYYHDSTSSWVSDLMYFTSSGNVGVGTTNPAYKLDVNGNARIAAYLTFADFSHGANTDYGRIGCFDKPYSVTVQIGGHGTTFNADNHCFRVINNEWNTDLFHVTNQGNVGIGTTSPSYKLHVVGNTYLSGDVFADELNTYDVIPRTSSTYDLGNSSYKWNNVYASSMIAGYIHGGGSALYLGNSDNSSYIYIREDMKASSESWSLTTSGTMSLSGDLTSGSYGSNCVAKFQGIGSGNGYCSVVELITNNEVSISYSNNSRYSDSRRWSVGRASSNSNYRFNFWNASYNGAVSYIDLNGNFWVAGGITMYSDRRKKTILRDVELSLKEVANAPLIEHYYNSDDKKTIHVGSIAQYWAGLNDWFCKLDSEGYYTMEVQNAALASAISVARELDRYETKTDKQIKKLKKRICELEEEVERLKSA